MFFSQYTLVFIFILLGIALPVIALTLGRFLRPSKPSAMKGTTYEILAMCIIDLRLNLDLWSGDAPVLWFPFLHSFRDLL